LPASSTRRGPDAAAAPSDKASAEQEVTMKEIVVATDGSPGATLAVEEGVWIAKQLGAKVVLVAVAKPALPFLGEPYYQLALSAELRRARAAVEAAVPLAEERRVPHEEEVVEGNPAEAVLETARARGADLIVVGSRGRGGVASGLLGSVSTEIVHRADLPVLVARGRTERDAAAA
jgi:nucleotide-binding universal stress UspA family protein